MRRRCALVAGIAAAAWAAAASAQEGPRAGWPDGYREALVALYEAGADSVLPFAQGMPSVREASAALDGAATSGPDEIGSFARALRQRFAAEVPLAGESSLFGRATGVRRSGGRVLLPARGLDPEPGAAVERVRRAESSIALSAGARPVDGVAVFVRGAMADSGIRLEEWEAAGTVRNTRLALGRGPVRYGRGLLLDASRLDHLEIASARPFLLPGPLTLVGPVTVHGLASLLTEERHGDDPLFLAGRFAFRPIPSVTIGANRALMLGGRENPTPLTPRNLVRTMIGGHAGDLANQIFTLDLHWRIPVQDGAAAVYVEWGMDDSSGSWYQVPGWVGGVRFPRILEDGMLLLAFEHLYFGRHCCANPPWYRHRRFAGNWVVGDEPLGRDLGGEGTESSVQAHLFAPESGWTVTSRVGVRSRGPYNLYAPEREGLSMVFDARLRYTFSRFAVEADGSLDSGSGWRTSRAALAIETRL